MVFNHAAVSSWGDGIRNPPSRQGTAKILSAMGHYFVWRSYGNYRCGIKAGGSRDDGGNGCKIRPDR